MVRGFVNLAVETVFGFCLVGAAALAEDVHRSRQGDGRRQGAHDGDQTVQGRQDRGSPRSGEDGIRKLRFGLILANRDGLPLHLKRPVYPSQLTFERQYRLCSEAMALETKGHIDKTS